MWVTKLKIRHDCIIGNRCEKFSVTTTGTPFSVYTENGVTYSPQVHRVDGDPENVRKFLKELKEDGHVQNFESEGNIFFITEVQKKKKVTASIFSRMGPRIIFVKPVFADRQGYEYWEIASWKKSILTDFITGVMNEVSKDIEIQKIEQTKLNDIYFSKLMPQLTENQKRAVTLAFENGYYSWPKKSDLSKLAKLRSVSVPTFREHLKRAEEKLMPDLMKLFKD